MVENNVDYKELKKLITAYNNKYHALYNGHYCHYLIYNFNPDSREMVYAANGLMVKGKSVYYIHDKEDLKELYILLYEAVYGNLL